MNHADVSLRPGHCKPAHSVLVARRQLVSSVLFARSSLGLLGFSASLPPPEHCPCGPPHNIDLHIIEPLRRPKQLRRAGRKCGVSLFLSPLPTTSPCHHFDWHTPAGGAKQEPLYEQVASSRNPSPSRTLDLPVALRGLHACIWRPCRHFFGWQTANGRGQYEFGADTVRAPGAGARSGG